MRSLSLGTRQSSELSFGLRLKNAAFQNGIIGHILYAEAEQLICGYQKLSSSTAHWTLDIRTHCNGVHIQDSVSLLTSFNNIHFCSDPKAKSFYAPLAGNICQKTGTWKKVGYLLFMKCFCSQKLRFGGPRNGFAEPS